MPKQTPKTSTPPEDKTYWMHDDQIEDLVSNAKAKGLTLDESIEKLASANYAINGVQVYLTNFVSTWHNHETNKKIKKFF